MALRPLRCGLPFLLAAALACGGDRQGGNFVNMYDNAFNAVVVRMPVGVRVKWINVGKNLHNAVAADPHQRHVAERGAMGWFAAV